MKEQYAEFGRFAITFEEICFNLRYVIRKIIHPDTMHFSIENTRTEILLQGLTAMPILDKFISIIKTSALAKDEELMKSIRILYSQFKNAIEIRNFLLHGTYTFGDPFGNTNNFQIMNPKLTKNGYKSNLNVYNNETFIALNDNLQKLSETIRTLISYLVSNRQEPLKEFNRDLKNIKIEIEPIMESF